MINKYVVMKIQPFEIEQSPKNTLRLPFPVVFDAGKMIGYLPVYDTSEDALADYPDTEVIMVRLKGESNANK